MTIEEYDRLIALFEKGRPEGMSDKTQADILSIFRKLKGKLAEFNLRKNQNR